MEKKRHNGFGERVRKARNAIPMSASQFARAVGVTPTCVWNWENDNTLPRSETLAVVETVLKVGREWLLNGEVSPAGHPGAAKEGSSPEWPTGADAPSAEAQLDLSTFPLEDLMNAITRKGFEVSVRPKGA
jgi:transcriptional regulator with XRE-family HTH domain